MICYLPLAGGHIKLAERFVDPAFSFALGWNVWYSCTVTSALSNNLHILNFIPGHIPGCVVRLVPQQLLLIVMMVQPRYQRRLPSSISGIQA